MKVMHTAISNVLVVDDDPIIRTVVTSFFAKHGVKNVRQASDGAQAIPDVGWVAVQAT